MGTAERLQPLVRELVEAKREYDRLVFDEEWPRQPGPPAAPAQLVRLERLFGLPLPRSYRAFLELHNGWIDFDGDGRLLAVEDQTSEWTAKRVAFWNNLWDPDLDNPFEHGALPILLGETKNSFLVLDRRRVHANGNVDFVFYDYMHEERSFEDFEDYLRYELDVTRRAIESKRSGEIDDWDEDGEAR